MKKALVVDDDDSIRAVLPVLLEAHQYDAEVTDSPQKALEIIAQRRFDVILTDYEMPGMNGIELIRVLREMSPLTAVILMTGRMGGDLFRSSGADGFLQKPFSTDSLRIVLGEATRSRAAAGAPKSSTQD